MDEIRKIENGSVLPKDLTISNDANVIQMQGEKNYYVKKANSVTVNNIFNAQQEICIAPINAKSELYNLIVTRDKKIEPNGQIIFDENSFYNDFTNNDLKNKYLDKVGTKDTELYTFPTLLLMQTDILNIDKFAVGICQLYSLEKITGFYLIKYKDFKQIDSSIISSNIDKLNIVIKKKNTELNLVHFALKYGNLNTILGGLYE